MSCAQKKDLLLCQGKTFAMAVRWETAPVVYKPVTAITQAAPARVTAALHGVPVGWRVAVVSVKGMKDINAKSYPPAVDDYHQATVVDANTVELNGVNAADFKPYLSGGYIQYNTPVDLAGFTARMTIKDKVGGAVLETLTDANGKIVLDNSTKSIRLALSAAVTAAYTWKKGVYDLELVSPAGVVSALLFGAVRITKEVTT